MTIVKFKILRTSEKQVFSTDFNVLKMFKRNRTSQGNKRWNKFLSCEYKSYYNIFNQTFNNNNNNQSIFLNELMISEKIFLGFSNEKPFIDNITILIYDETNYYIIDTQFSIIIYL